MAEFTTSVKDDIERELRRALQYANALYNEQLSTQAETYVGALKQHLQRALREVEDSRPAPR